MISVELVPIHERLVVLRRELSWLSGEQKPNKAEYKTILEELRTIDAYVFPLQRSCNALRRLGRIRVDGKFLGPGGSSVPEGQALLSGLLDSCFDVCQDLKAREAEEDVCMSLKPIYERLSSMKAELEQLGKSGCVVASALLLIESSAHPSVDFEGNGSV